jgi:hypothetical protein
MTINMSAKNNKKVRPGVALLVVLFIVMAITILSLGFVSRSDVELACGQNMVMRARMDYLAESGLEHARGLILNPQDVSTDFWTGDTDLQLTSGSDFYDVWVDRDANDFCNYIIDCNSYRLQGGDTIGRSSVRATLRLDPCIAYWVGLSTTVSSAMTIKGDVYCGDNLTNNGDINGDVFADGTIDGTNPQGRKNESVASAPVAWPNLLTSDFGPTHYYIGLTQYQTQLLDPNIPLDPSEVYSAGVYYSVDDVNMPGGVTVNGTLVVSGNLIVSGPNNVITAVNDFHFPALVVIGQVIMEDGASLVINGLAQIGGPIITVDPNPTIRPRIDVIGSLFIANDGVTSDKVWVDITAAPAIASINIWSETGIARRWGPAAGAFFRSIERR